MVIIFLKTFFENSIKIFFSVHTAHIFYSRLPHIKVLMQGKLIAVAYTLRTY